MGVVPKPGPKAAPVIMYQRIDVAVIARGV